MDELGDDDDDPKSAAGGKAKKEELAALRKKNPSDLTPAEEQLLARQEFLSAAFGGADEKEDDVVTDAAGLLKKRKRTEVEEEQFENEYKTFLQNQADTKHKTEVNQIGKKITGDMMSDFWMSQDGLDENERFLREFVSAACPLREPATNSSVNSIALL